ncbi:hypothetical protein F5J12DRAFT_907243 [Pisolithus orientalis]|uniref:uncharacterized protein n=1 Tax=Pisolithus orientalis TaxID=936130 RepID=UPI0022259539|nr:uncharacterized protein F5J12DRAFT_907243 [Pisolithus orientalis]KAI5994569.1 hypothetical protein F5J12DRAFT_907243 [Pisolithus orientalis]
MGARFIAENPVSDRWSKHINNHLEFETAQLLFSQAQLSAGKIDQLLHLWGLSLAPHQDTPPFADHTDLYETIDVTPTGDAPWESFRLKYSGNKPSEGVPSWMNKSYDVWFQDPQVVIKNILSNTDFNAEIDYALYHEFSADSHSQRYKDFMSSKWAWEHTDEIAKEPQADGATFILIILGSDKTTISVAMGQNDYWPIYLSIGNVHNHVQHVHHNSIILVALLPIPKASKKHSDDTGMMTPEVLHCPDGHVHRIIYGLGPYIADYPEQVLLACIVQNWCGQCMATPDNLDGGGVPCSCSLADMLKHVFSLVELWDEWGMDVEIELFTDEFPQASIYLLLAPDILHQLIKGMFKDHLVEWGWGFSQWTGNDSKALMKVYLPAIEGYVLDKIVHTFWAFLEFCYLVWRDAITDETLYKALGQMLLTNQHLDKLTAAAVDFEKHRMLKGSIALSHSHYLSGNCATKVLLLADKLGVPAFPNLLQEFLSHQLNTLDTELQCLATPTGCIKVFHSASVMIGSTFHEQIQATPSWYGGPEHYDTVFVNTDDTHDGMEGTNVAQVLCFFLLPCTNGLSYPCALIHWFDYIADIPDELTGMWMIKPSFLDNRTHHLAVVHINTII